MTSYVLQHITGPRQERPRERSRPDARFHDSGGRQRAPALPRFGASAPTRVDARFAPPAGGRRTLGINGKEASASQTAAGCGPSRGQRALSGESLVRITIASRVRRSCYRVNASATGRAVSTLAGRSHSPTGQSRPGCRRHARVLQRSSSGSGVTALSVLQQPALGAEHGSFCRSTVVRVHDRIRRCGGQRSRHRNGDEALIRAYPVSHSSGRSDSPSSSRHRVDLRDNCFARIPSVSRTLWRLLRIVR